MYDQNDISQSSKRSEGLRRGERSGLATQGVSDRTAVPCVKLVTNGSGKVWAVDENGKPLGNTTDNSAIRTQQGFQAIKERFKLLDSARKYLMENALNTVSIIV